MVMDDRYTQIQQDINKLTEGDWNCSRSRIYITIRIRELEKVVERLSEELTFEKEVNRRVELALASAYVK